MFDVMLVDDDSGIRDYLRSIIEWDRLNLRLSCEAGDSETAWELFQSNHPKIVITDISIPIISGLELAKKLRAEDESVRIIVITGYCDFDYVRETVSLGAVDLLSKPIAPEEINKSLQKAVDYFDHLQRSYEITNMLKVLLAENKGLLQERYVAKLFSRQEDCEANTIRQQMDSLSLNLSGRYFSAVVIVLGEIDSGILDSAAFSAAFKHLCENIFGTNEFLIYTFWDTPNQLHCLLNWSFEQGENRIERILATLLENTRFYFHCDFFATIGSTVESPCQIHHSASQALWAQRFCDDSFRSVMRYTNLSAFEKKHKGNVKQMATTLAELAQTSQHQKFYQLLEAFCSEAEITEIKEISLELLTQLINLCLSSSSINPWDQINYPEALAAILNNTEKSAVQNNLTKVCQQLVSLLIDQQKESQNQLILAARQFIHQNYQNPDLSLDVVSAHVNLSKIYFCQLFSKETGCTFTTYLNEKRIDEGKKLLASTNKRISEISAYIGFNNPKYFNYVFKRMVGMTPLDYRKQITK